MGGTPTEWEASYGFVRYLTPDEVKEVAQVLNDTSTEHLRARYDARGNTEIYAQGDVWDEETWEVLMRAYNHLVKFFNQAATHGEVVLISSD